MYLGVCQVRCQFQPLKCVLPSTKGQGTLPGCIALQIPESSGHVQTSEQRSGGASQLPTPNFHFLHSSIHSLIPQAYIQKRDEETVMQLCYAAKRGDHLQVSRLVSGGFDLNMADYDGRTALVHFLPLSLSPRDITCLLSFLFPPHKTFS